jgi:hypothetical protein
MQEQPNPDHERDDPAQGHEEALYASLRQAKKKQNSRYHKAREYFSEWKNWVSDLTLLFVAAYTIITLSLYFSAREANKLQLIEAKNQVSEAKRQADTAQAIMLANERATLTSEGMILNAWPRQNVGDGHLHLKAMFKNVGKAFATIVGGGAIFTATPIAAVPRSADCGPENPTFKHEVPNDYPPQTVNVVTDMFNEKGEIVLGEPNYGWVQGYADYADPFTKLPLIGGEPIGTKTVYFCYVFDFSIEVTKTAIGSPLQRCEPYFACTKPEK